MQGHAFAYVFAAAVAAAKCFHPEPEPWAQVKAALRFSVFSIELSRFSMDCL